MALAKALVSGVITKKDVELFRQFQRSPILFVRHMWGLLPQPKDGRFLHGKHFTWQQHEILKAVEDGLNHNAPRRISISAGRGIGKTSTLAWIILWYLFCHKDAQLGCTAPDAQQIYDVLWKECAKWLRSMPNWAQAQYIWSSDHIRMKERPETWFARAKTAKKESPDALAGLHGEYVMVVADEAAGIDEEIFNIAEGSLTGDHWLFIIVSNYRRLWGYFHETQTKGRGSWNIMRFDSRESPIVEKNFIEEKLKHSLGNEEDDEFRVEVRGLPPRSDEMDKEGWVPLIIEEDLERCYTPGLPFTGVVRIGVDPSGEGENVTAWVARDRYVARIIGMEQMSDEKSVAQKTLTLIDHLGVSYDNVTVDNFGSGANVSREIALSGFHNFPRVNSVNVGEQADDPERYTNLRAEASLRLREWLLGGGKLVQDERWKEILSLRYRRNRQGRIEVIPKLKLRERSIPSPNFFDALMLTFVHRGEEFAPTHVGKKSYRPVWQGYNRT